MQSSRLVDCLRKIDEGLRLAEWAPIIRPLVDVGNNADLRQSKALLRQLVWSARENFMSLRGEPSTAAVLETFGLVELFGEDMQTYLLTTVQSRNASVDIHRNPTDLAAFLDFITRVEAVHALRIGMTELVVAPRREALGTDDEALELRVLDFDGHGLLPSRLKAILEAIEDLHDAVVQLEGSDGVFRISYLDSGSDWMVAVQSVRPLIELLRTALRQWERMRTLGLDGMAREGHIAIQHLDLLKRIEEERESGRLAEDKADHIRARVLSRLEALTAYGVVSEAAEEAAVEAQRKLLTARRAAGLLTESKESADEHGS